MFETCEVVRVVSVEHEKYGGFKEINKSDFDPAVHKPFIEPGVPSSPPPAENPFKTMSVRDMRAMLDGLGVAYDKDARADVLRELCQKATS